MSEKQFDIESEEYRLMLHDYHEFISNFIQSFTMEVYSKGIIEDIEPEELQKFLLSPDDNIGTLSELAEYFYLSTGEIHMMFELIESLPTLNYKIGVFDKVENHDRYTSMINKVLHKIKYKPLTRDILKQTGNMGTLTGIWLGNKNNIYPYIFDDPTKVFPAYRKNGDWILYLDLQMLDQLKGFYLDAFFDNFSPFVTKKMYDRYQSNPSDSELRYIPLPQERTFVIHTHKLKRNQSFGAGWANPAMFDIIHKKRMKNVERAIANKIINAIAVLTIGNEKDPDKFGNLQLSTKMKRAIHTAVKAALEKNAADGVSLIAIPEFAKLDFPDVKTDGLDGKKFEHLNNDIQSSLGVSSAILNGTGGNHASSRLNLSIFYKRIAVMLEQIESDMYQKMINLILPKGQADNFYIEFDKSEPLTTKEKVDALRSLNDKGWSTKHLVSAIGVDWNEYLDQTLYETEELKLQDKIKPYQTSHTQSSKKNGEAPNTVSDNDLTDEGASTRDSGKNEM